MVSDQAETGMGQAESVEFIAEMMETFKDDEAADLQNRREALTDLQFQALRQWAPEKLAERTGRPTFVVDMLNPFIRQIEGQLHRSPPQGKVYPGEDGDSDTAEVIGGLWRSVQYQSYSDFVYASAAGQAAACGMGHWRLSLEFESATKGRNRCLRVRGISNPLAVLRNSDCVMPDHSDATRCWVMDDMSRKAFKAKWPEAQASAFGGGTTAAKSGWFSSDTVRVCELHQVKHTPGTITFFDDGSEWDDLDHNKRYELILSGRRVMEVRNIQRPSVCMYILTGAEVLGKWETPYTRIPIFTVEGETINIDGERVRTSLIRGERDKQIIRNWGISHAVEHVALQSLQKWLVEESHIVGNEEVWRNANRSPHAVLPYKPGPNNSKPERIAPPTNDSAALELSDKALDWAREGTGMFAASFGQADGAGDSGKKVDLLMQQGDLVNSRWFANTIMQIEATGREFCRTVDKVYDTPRQVHILGEDMQPKVVRASLASKGIYDLIVKTGPSQATAKREMTDGMREALRYLPGELAVPVVVRLAESEEWPRAEELAAEIRQIATAKGLLAPQNPMGGIPSPQNGAQISPDALANGMSDPNLAASPPMRNGPPGASQAVPGSAAAFYEDAQGSAPSARAPFRMIPGGMR